MLAAAFVVAGAVMLGTPDKAEASCGYQEFYIILNNMGSSPDESSLTDMHMAMQQLCTYNQVYYLRQEFQQDCYQHFTIELGLGIFYCSSYVDEPHEQTEFQWNWWYDKLSWLAGGAGGG